LAAGVSVFAEKPKKIAAQFDFGLKVTAGSLTALKVALNLAPEASRSDG
jgi:hypothetical protein